MLRTSVSCDDTELPYRILRRLRRGSSIAMLSPFHHTPPSNVIDGQVSSPLCLEAPKGDSAVSWRVGGLCWKRSRHLHTSTRYLVVLTVGQFPTMLSRENHAERCRVAYEGPDLAKEEAIGGSNFKLIMLVFLILVAGHPRETHKCHLVDTVSTESNWCTVVSTCEIAIISDGKLKGKQCCCFACHLDRQISYV